METSQLVRRIRVARGEEPGDLLIRNARIINVFTETIAPGNVVIVDGVIAGVGPYNWHAAETIDVHERLVAPSLIDAHMHIESTLLTPAELARVVVPHGTGLIIADPHEIANVMGVRGIKQMIGASEGLPLECRFMAPSCVPASPFERAGAVLDVEAIREVLAHERVLGLAEMMNYPGVINAEDGVLAKVAATLEAGKVVDGHCPGLLDQELVAYAAAGIRSDHECTSVEEAVQRAALGMLVQVREGSMARNLDTLLPPLVEGRLGRWCLCTDDVHPEDLVEFGHINHLLRRVVEAGVPLAEAVRHATFVPAQHYGLHDRGAVGPAYRADLVVFDDERSLKAAMVIRDGDIVAREGHYLFDGPATNFPAENTMRLGALDASMFEYSVSGSEVPVIGIIPDQIVTTHERRRVAQDGGRFSFDPAADLALIACVQRHQPDGRIGMGVVSGFGFTRHGALASTVGHDAHNLLIAGTNASDMLVAARALQEVGGGFVVVADRAVQQCMPLPVAGLLSTESVEEVLRHQRTVNDAAAELGCRLHAPFGTLSFLGLSVIPALKITDAGLFDVERFALVEASA
jgi:adenine deaminase